MTYEFAEKQSFVQYELADLLHGIYSTKTKIALEAYLRLEDELEIVKITVANTEYSTDDERHFTTISVNVTGDSLRALVQDVLYAMDEKF